MTSVTGTGPSRRSVLMVFTSIPFPARAHGISVRYLPIIRHLARSYDLDLIIFNGRNDPSAARNLESLRDLCRTVRVLRHPRSLEGSLRSKIATYGRFVLPWSPPLSVVANSGNRVVRGLAQSAGGIRYDVLVWIGSYLAPYLFQAAPSLSVGRIVIDFIDSPYLMAKRWKGAVFKNGLLERYECWKMMRWEAGLIRRAAAVYISSVDAAAVPERLTPGRKRHVVPNGILADSYSTGGKEGIPSPNIGFIGNMAYFPNVEAVHWLYNELFVPLRARMPDLSLIVIGRKPVESVADLGKKPGVIVTGTVDDVWPYINSVDVFVFPIWTGTGLKNKVLEAMYAGRPVVTTPIGTEGIGAVPGRDLLVCENAEEFRRHVERLLERPDERLRLGKGAQEFVAERFALPRIVERFEAVLNG